MKRHLAFLMLWIIGAAVQAAPEDSKKVLIRWHGQSFFEMKSSKGTRIVFDPHAIEVYERLSVEGDLVLVSHFHNDHNQIGMVENKDKKVLWGLKKDKDKKTEEWNPIDEKFKDVHIRTIGTYHDTSEGLERGKNAIFIVDIDGMRVVHLGNLGHLLDEKQVKAIGTVDVLMIPVGGVYTIHGTDARKVVEQLKPRKYIIPMHYGTKVFDNVLPVDEFLQDTKKERVKRLDTNEFIVDTAFKPEQPPIMILDWKKKEEIKEKEKEKSKDKK